MVTGPLDSPILPAASGGAGSDGDRARERSPNGRSRARFISAFRGKGLHANKELAATVGLANWTNRFNETFGVQLP
jgi:hypothetical protein